MTEKQERQNEELKTIDDYLEQLERISDLMVEADTKSKSIEALEKMYFRLVKALDQKYKYVLKSSAKWRKSQGLFSRIKDCREEKRIEREKEREARRKEMVAHVESMKKAREEEKKVEEENKEESLLAPEPQVLLQPKVVEKTLVLQQKAVDGQELLDF